jgi:DNA-binding response OmpR family regulator
MDMQMPRLDGLAAARRIRDWQRQQGERPSAIIALTASVLDEDKLAARDAGMDGFSSKPVDLDSLNREIARVLGIALPTPAPRAAARDRKAGLTPGPGRCGSCGRRGQASLRSTSSRSKISIMSPGRMSS